MKKFCVVLAALMMFGFVSSAFAAIEVTGDAYVSVNSMYLWRGFDLSEDDNFVVQPGTDLSVGGFTLGWWGNMSENDGNLNEVDIVLDYSFDLGEMLSLSVGNILYDVDGVDDTNELYLNATLNTILEPSLGIYVDYDEFDTVFYTLSVGHNFDLADNASLSLSTLVSYLSDDDNGFGTDESWFHNAEVSVGLDYAVNDQISISPVVVYSTPIDDDAEDIAGIDDEFMGGATVTLAF